MAKRVKPAKRPSKAKAKARASNPPPAPPLKQPSEFARARARRDQAQALFLELRTAKERGKLIDADEAERIWSAEIAAAKAQILALPTAWADRMHRAATLEGVVGVERVLRQAVHQVLLELAAGEHRKKRAAGA